MALLRDQELIANISVQHPSVPWVEGVELPANPYSKKSPVQASSIDLHIGNIYLPGKNEFDLGGANREKTEHSLTTGETAVVTTQEILHLPGNIAGIGFPPSRVSFKGLLMTNPGHVDPGYEGVLRFTVINMAKDSYSLKRGEEVVTLLLFKLDEFVHSDWRQRNPEGSRLPNHASISRLSSDFVDVTHRAEDIARRQGQLWSGGIAAVATVIVGILALIGSGHLFDLAGVGDLKRRLDIVEYDLKNRVNVEQKLQDFDNRLKDLVRTTSHATAKLAEPKNPGNTTNKVSGKRQ